MVPDELLEGLDNYLAYALADTTKHNYAYAWTRFCNFTEMANIPISFPVPVTVLSIFITKLAQEGLRYSTIKSTLSGLSYLHHFYEVQNPVNAFMINKLLLGIRKSQANLPSRQCRPIDSTLLAQLIGCLPFVVPPYEAVLYTAIFNICYYGCMRIGEVVLSTETAHVALLEHLTTEIMGDGSLAYRLYMPSFKHSRGRKPTLRLRMHPLPACPVTSLTRYLMQQASPLVHLFCHQNATPVTRTHVLDVLRQCFTYLGMPAMEYGTHSFRVGRCTDLVAMGLSDAQLRTSGRWASDAYKVYIRPDIIDC